jgi:predicted transglutaminase-like cysteine proteinase
LCAVSVFAEITGLTDKLLDQVARTYGQEAKKRLIDWQSLISSGKNRSEAEKLALVNSFFNRVAFVDDIIHWKKPDYWATPVEMLATNGGDCEDFSIAKYLTLREMGVPDERMLITYVKSVKLNQAHMVLTYYPAPDAEPMVLDNLVGDIKPASERTDLLPVYSFNGGGLWLSKERGRGRRVGSSEQISLWRDLETRIKKEKGR